MSSSVSVKLRYEKCLLIRGNAKQAVEAGELDAQIEAAALKLREGFVK
jgi:hypothetical protein